MEPIRFLLNQTHDIRCEAEKLHKILTHLRYEGKVSFGKNLKRASETLEGLQVHFKEHQALYEKVIFPFLEKRIPKTEAMFQFLRTDHGHILDYLKKIKASWRKLKKNPHLLHWSSEMQAFSLYLMCLIQHHVRSENERLKKAIEKELRPEEIHEIKRQVRKWSCSKKLLSPKKACFEKGKRGYPVAH